MEGSHKPHGQSDPGSLPVDLAGHRRGRALLDHRQARFAQRLLARGRKGGGDHGAPGGGPGLREATQPHPGDGRASHGFAEVCRSGMGLGRVLGKPRKTSGPVCGRIDETQPKEGRQRHWARPEYPATRRPCLLIDPSRWSECGGEGASV